MVECNSFIRRLIMEISSSRFKYHHVRPILTKIVYGSTRLTSIVCDTIIEMLHVLSDPVQIKAVMRAVYIVCSVEDEFQVNRISLTPMATLPKQQHNHLC